jgi:hypothetical protein
MLDVFQGYMVHAQKSGNVKLMEFNYEAEANLIKQWHLTTGSKAISTQTGKMN